MKKVKSSKKKKNIIIALSSFICIVFVLFAAMPPMIMGEMVNMHMDVDVLEATDFGIESKSLNLTTEDELSLAAWEVEVENPKGVVILLSGIQNPSVTAFFGYSRLLQDNGYASLLIEMRGHGDSDGERVSLGMEEYLDVKAGVEYIKNNTDYEDVPIIVWGTSMGGVTAINATGEIPEIDGLISCSAYSSWEDVFCDNMIMMGMPSVIAAIEKPFVKLYIGFSFGFDKIKINPLKEIQKLDGRPTLLAHSTEDSQIPFTSFERIIDKVKDQENIQLFIREGDEHFICYDEFSDDPQLDTEFSSAILSFLDSNFN